MSVNKDYEQAVQCHRAGLLDRAVKLCHKVLAQRPRHAQALHLRGVIAQQQDDPQAAAEWHLKAVTAKPDYPQAHNSLGGAWYACKRYDEALASFRNAVAIKPDYAQAHRNLGILLKDCGLLEESIAAQKKAFAAQPSWHEAHSGVLLSRMGQDGVDPATLLAEHREWDRIHAGHLVGTPSPHTNCRAVDRRLRVGLVSPDFKKHPVMRFLLPFLKHHDRRQIELFAYAHVPGPDDWTALARDHVEHWRSLVDVPDATAAELIRGDEIDILVDLAGHTHGNRLMVFARKPAPVQATYLGYPGTTGLHTMDYRITDAIADPPGLTESHHSEQLLRLPGCAWCYHPDSE